jgi:mRNA interferase MazF
MKRGEIWIVAGGGKYTNKPRPAVIIQDDRFDTDSITICPLTSDSTDAPILRLVVAPDSENGIRETSRGMVDKISSVPRSNLRSRIGRLKDHEMLLLNRAMMVFLGIAA